MSRFAVIAIAACVVMGCAKTDDATKSDSKKTDPVSKSTAKKQSKKLPPFTPPTEVKMTTASPDDLKKFIADHKGQVVFVDYWGVFCPPCRKHFPHSVELSRKHAQDGLVVVSVCIDAVESQVEAIKFLKSKDAQIVNFGSPVEDIEASLDAFEIEGGAIPRYRVYDTSGELVLNIQGGEEKKIDAAIMKALGYE